MNVLEAVACKLGVSYEGVHVRVNVATEVTVGVLRRVAEGVSPTLAVRTGDFVVVATAVPLSVDVIVGLTLLVAAAVALLVTLTETVTDEVALNVRRDNDRRTVIDELHDIMTLKDELTVDVGTALQVAAVGVAEGDNLEGEAGMLRLAVCE